MSKKYQLPKVSAPKQKHEYKPRPGRNKRQKTKVSNYEAQNPFVSLVSLIDSYNRILPKYHKDIKAKRSSIEDTYAVVIPERVESYMDLYRLDLFVSRCSKYTGIHDTSKRAMQYRANLQAAYETAVTASPELAEIINANTDSFNADEFTVEAFKEVLQDTINTVARYDDMAFELFKQLWRNATQIIYEESDKVRRQNALNRSDTYVTVIKGTG